MVPDVSDCIVPYHGHGIVFDYPDVWEVTEEYDESDDSMLITVTVDETCFWSVRVMPECPAPIDVVESCVTGYREEYGEIEAMGTQQSLAEMPATGRVVQFECFELLNTASLLCVRYEEFSLLCWWQGTDHELQSLRPIMDQMTGSVRILNLL
jgi:hypothetical protein